MIDKVFEVAEAEFQIPKLLDANDMLSPDELSVMTYVSYFRQKDKLTPEEHIKRAQQPAAASSSKPTPAPTTTAAPAATSSKPVTAAPRLKTIHAEGEGLSHAICGDEALFTLLTKDEHGNVFYQADTMFEGTLELSQLEVPTTIVDSKDGIFRGSYTLQTAGMFCVVTAHALIDSRNLRSHYFAQQKDHL